MYLAWWWPDKTSKHVAPINTYSLSSADCWLCNYELKINWTTNLKNVIHISLPSLNLHCLLESDGQWRTGTKRNNVQRNADPVLSSRERLANIASRKALFVGAAIKHTIYIEPTENCPLLLPTSAYKLNSRHQSVPLKTPPVQQNRASSSQFSPQSVTIAQFDMYSLSHTDTSINNRPWPTNTIQFCSPHYKFLSIFQSQ